MDFSTVKKWIIPEGEVLKVVDSNGDIIWRKYYKVWIANLYAGPCETDWTRSYDISKFSIDEGNNWEPAQTGTIANSTLNQYILVPAGAELKIKFDILQGATSPSAGEEFISCYLTDTNQYETYDNIISGWESGNYDCSDYTNAKTTISNVSYNSYVDYDMYNGSLAVNPTKDSILYLGWEKYVGVIATNPSWDLPSKKYLAPIATNFNINITDSDSASWKLESDSNWISINLFGQQTYSGTGNSTSYIYISENDSDIKRTGYLKLYTGSTLLKTLQIIQGGKTGKLTWGTTIKSVIDPSGDSFVLPYSSTNAGTISVTHNANGSWFIASNVDNSISCHASANTTGRIRSVILKVTGTNAQSISMSMSQESK